MRREKRVSFFVWFICFFLLAGMLWFPREAFGAEQRVFDEAGLFSAQEAADLETAAAACIKETGSDVVIVTAYNDGEHSAEQYADDFYDNGGFGKGKNADGSLFLLYMDGPGESSGEMWISTSGIMIRVMTDDRISDTEDSIAGFVRNRVYAGGAQMFLDCVESYVHQGILEGQYNYDRDTGEVSWYYSITFGEALFAFVVSAGIAGLACVGVKNRYKMKRSLRDAENGLLAYRSQCQFQFAHSTDNLINQFVTTARIPKNTSSGGGHSSGSSSAGRSTTHHSSSGRTHGGGGRRF